MHSETVFILAYSVALLVAAAGLHRLGKVNRNPSSNRAAVNPDRAGAGSGQRSENPGWPHDESARLHSVMGLTAVAATIVLLFVEAVRHHRPIELVAIGAVAVVAIATLVRLANTLLDL